MTLLSIAQNIAKDTKSGEIPSTIYSNSNATAVQLFSSIRRATKIVAQAHEWQVLTAEYNFNTVNGTESYSLPSAIDGSRIIENTVWNSTLKRPLVGSLSPQEWQALKRSTNFQIDKHWRIRGGSFLLTPTPTAAETIYYEYIKNTPVQSSGGTAQTDWAADTDTSVLDEFLIELQAKWIYLDFQGKPYLEAQKQADDMLATRVSQDGSRRSVYNRSILTSQKDWGSDLQAITPP